MAFWSFIQCRWCGFSGCSAPIGDRCPMCNRDLELELDPPKKKKAEAVESQTARA